MGEMGGWAKTNTWELRELVAEQRDAGESDDDRRGPGAEVEAEADDPVRLDELDERERLRREWRLRWWRRYWRRRRQKSEPTLSCRCFGGAS